LHTDLLCDDLCFELQRCKFLVKVFMIGEMEKSDSEAVSSYMYFLVLDVLLILCKNESVG